MSFDLFEKSVDRGAPVELYEFVYGEGATNVMRYTNSTSDVETEGSVVWKSIPVTRDAFKSNGKMEKTTLSVRMPIDKGPGAFFIDWPPPQPVMMRIWAGHLTDDPVQWLVIWAGTVQSVAKQGREAVLSADNTLISLLRPGLRRNWQYGCPYVLYGAGCNANREAATRLAKVTSVSSGTVTLEAGWFGDLDPAKFANGMMSWISSAGREYRSIRAVSAEGALSLVGPIRGLEVDQEVEVILGCNHQMSDCANLHGNIVNYGGQPWIPLQNPTQYHNFW